MGKKLIALVLCFIMLSSAVFSADVIKSDDEDDTISVLITAYGSARNFFYGGSQISSGTNLYGKTLTGYGVYETYVNFQVAISSWVEVSSLYFDATDDSVAEISVSMTSEKTHIFTVRARGFGKSDILMYLNESDPVTVFSIIVMEQPDDEKKDDGKDDGKEEGISEEEWKYILQEAGKRIPNVFILDGSDNIVSGKTSKIEVGDSENYHIGLGSSILNSGTVDFYFYTYPPYYFFLDTENVKWTASGKSFTNKTTDKGITLQGVSAGEGTLKAQVPISVLYFPEKYEPGSKDAYSYEDFGDYRKYDYELWDLGNVDAETTIQVAEKPAPKVQKKVPYNPFTDIDVSKVPNPFMDISSKDWFYKSVMYLYAAGILNGVDFSGKTVYYNPGNGLDAGKDKDTSYRIDMLSTDGSEWLSAAEITRFLSGSAYTAAPSGSSNVRFEQSVAQNRQNSVVQLYNGHKSIGYTIASYANNPFTDVKAGTNSYQPILWASNNGIVNGYGNGKFGPDDHITREQFCAILVRHAQMAGITFQVKNAAKTFTDGSQISSWASSAVVTCQRAGIIQGYPDGSFNPQGDITRAEMCEMIYKYLDQIPQ